ncbi:poly-gamma-glutamate hydrolase family protein [Cereibacter azotoformans]|uniref:poly-gamma-glutamate hydrolase family protein n=1 Tax=Cereibacter azotoformans TaxID=43057 RepID=UPI001EEC31BA|nr:poly-gamma-glutamate hydrolase family protein [Cereibacter azotoformans]ULB11847.1 poly-gamma-glutamate hydrolase family protein [Cereibacter azotoformans]
MANDKYSSFEQLFAHEKYGIDYSIVVEDKGSDVLIMAPHGGKIEPGTSEIAFGIARADLSLYCFDGLRTRPHGDLHITSHKYDEPQAIDAAERCEVVVAIHGRSDRDDPATVWLGGLDVLVLGEMENQLKLAGFSAEIRSGELGGAHPCNICNRGRSGRGVQLELPKSLRDELKRNPASLVAFSEAIRRTFSADRD